MTYNTELPWQLPLSMWPKADREAWVSMFLSGDDWGSGGGRAAHWSAGTSRLRQQGYGTWMSFLTRTRPYMLVLPAHERVTRDAVKAYFEECEIRLKHRSIATLLSALAEVMFALAPDQDWSWIRRASNSFLTTSGTQALKPLPDLSAREVFQGALKQISNLKRQMAVSSQPSPVANGVAFREALMVAILISCPVRSRAFVALTISGHVERAGGKTFLNFRPEDMKTKKASRVPLHPELEALFTEYLELHRPALLRGRKSDYLWISGRKTDYSADSFTGYLAIYTKRNFGEEFRAHKFRHIAASSIAEEMPEQANIIKDILGHSTIRTSEKHYNRAKAIGAGRELSTIIAKHKQFKKAQKK
jgi:integrase/recombinase XerD